MYQHDPADALYPEGRDESVEEGSMLKQAIVDGVNAGEDIFLIEAEVTKNGAHIMKQLIEHRDRLSRIEYNPRRHGGYGRYRG